MNLYQMCEDLYRRNRRAVTRRTLLSSQKCLKFTSSGDGIAWELHLYPRDQHPKRFILVAPGFGDERGVVILTDGTVGAAAITFGGETITESEARHILTTATVART